MPAKKIRLIWLGFSRSVIRITSVSPISFVGFNEILITGFTLPSGLEAVDERKV